MESTENIYKYHMQMQEGAVPAGTKIPPAPLVQTSVGGNHSRSSSHASSQGTLSLNASQVLLTGIKVEGFQETQNQVPETQNNIINVKKVPTES